MASFVQWVSNHAEIALLIVVTVFAISFIFTHRKSLFYKE